jgi:FixJ family two-component response regulator
VQHITFEDLRRADREPNLLSAPTPLPSSLPCGLIPVSFSSDKALVIVDDEKSYADLLARLLADSLKCPIRAFTRPLEALEEIPTLNAGVIVTDYYMPGINGLEFVRRLQTVAPDLPVVMITGHMMELAETDHSDLPALKAILAKPFSWRLLADEIIRHWPEAGLTKADSASL